MKSSNLQELRDQCGNSNNKDKLIYTDFAFDLVCDQDDWESDWAAMLHFAKHNSVKGIVFTDWQIHLQ